MNLQERLALLRQIKGIRQKELALYLHVTVGTVSNYENGIHQPDLITLCKLADYYEVTTDYLLGRGICHASASKSPEKEPLLNLREEIFHKSAMLSESNLHTLNKFIELLMCYEIDMIPKNMPFKK